MLPRHTLGSSCGHLGSLIDTTTSPSQTQTVCITGPKSMYEQHQDVFGQHQIHLVQANRQPRKKRDKALLLFYLQYQKIVNDLEVCPLIISIYEGRWFGLFCFVVMRSTEPGCFKSCSWCLWKALNEERCMS
jgi:hypothetical protein